MPDTFDQRLSRINQQIAAAARTAHRDPSTVTLTAVTKRQPLAALRDAIAAGHRCFGENRLQEAQLHWRDSGLNQTPDLALHMIGPLQTNKAIDACRLFDTIETLDRPKLAAALLAAADKVGRMPRLLVQVNTGAEPQKAGIPPDLLGPFLETVREQMKLPLAGLMCIPPVHEAPAPHFALLAKLARSHGLSVLSMGMSGDFTAAIHQGATHVRLGTALFGDRQP